MSDQQPIQPPETTVPPPQSQATPPPPYPTSSAANTQVAGTPYDVSPQQQPSSGRSGFGIAAIVLSCVAICLGLICVAVNGFALANGINKIASIDTDTTTHWIGIIFGGAMLIGSIVALVALIKNNHKVAGIALVVAGIGGIIGSLIGGICCLVALILLRRDYTASQAPQTPGYPYGGHVGQAGTPLQYGTGYQAPGQQPAPQAPAQPQQHSGQYGQGDQPGYGPSM